ncbi:MAG: hypothetical protein EOM15_16295 [Spirochaetia bacterium]|nr:hypothetical protein [Spirochaetia bacterium]
MATRLTLYRRSILTQYNARKPGMTDLVFCKHHKIKIQELECWKTLAATEVAEVIFAVKAQESKKKPEERASLFDSGTLSMIEVFSGRPEADEGLLPEVPLLIEKLRMQVMLKIASLPCSIRHVEYLYNLEESLDAIR